MVGLQSLPSYNTRPVQSINDFSGVINLWASFLKERGIPTNPYQFKAFLEHIFLYMDDDGIYNGTLEDISQATDLTHYIIRKKLNMLQEYSLLYRRYGLIVVNVKAFDEEGIKNHREGYFC